MPTYEYKCGDCGHRFEKIQKISDPSRIDCPRCDGVAERLISGGAGLLFKGSGFYATDYRSESYKKAADQEAKKPSEATPAAKKAEGSDTGKKAAGSKGGGGKKDPT